jgi:epoxyqueuosine reductase
MLDSAPLKARARALGFDACAVTSAEPLPGADHLARWLSLGMAGDMAPWLGRDPAARANPRALLPQARSLITLGLNYYQPRPPRRGTMARYALGRDYHDLIPPKLRELDAWLAAQGGIQRAAVDTSALLERSAAARAGLGWIGKNTMLLHRRFGNWLFLAELLTSLEFTPDPPQTGHCGSCTRCLDICPTRAFTGPHQLDARRCIAYLTIEHKGPIPEELRPLIGAHVFGCDDCLDICPWNRWAAETREAGLRPLPFPDLREMLAWDDAAFRKHFRGTPVFRLKRNRWLRNVCVVLGNTGDAPDLPALELAARDPDPLVAEHAAWAASEIVNRISPHKPANQLAL